MNSTLVFTATYNEAQNVKNLIDQILKAAEKTDILIIDDNIHSGTDFFKIFGDINKLIDKMENESSKISEEEQNA
jgi:glycosyltransferase involved in cell wall biosynthesis